MKLKLARPQSPFISIKKKPFQKGTYKKPNMQSKAGSRYSGQKVQKPQEQKRRPAKQETKETNEFSSEEFEPYDMDDDGFEDLPDVDVKTLVKKTIVKPSFAMKKKRPGQKNRYNYVKPSEEVASPTKI